MFYSRLLKIIISFFLLIFKFVFTLLTLLPYYIRKEEYGYFV